jgi:hypothetical protein
LVRLAKKWANKRQLFSKELRSKLKLSYSSSWGQWWRESAVSVNEQQCVAVDILLSAIQKKIIFHCHQRALMLAPAAERKQLSPLSGFHERPMRVRQ